MTLRTKTLSAALAMAICAGVPALAQDAITIVPAPVPADQAPVEAPAAPAGNVADQADVAPTQSSEPTSTGGAADMTPMEAPAVPSVTADGGSAAMEGDSAQQPAADAVGLTEGEEAAVPVETTETVVTEERHDDVEGAAGAEGEQGGTHVVAHIEDIAYSFEGPFGTYDQFQLQRGLQVYTEVCSSCHGMKFVPIRTLHDDGGPGLPEDQVRAYAANLTPVLDPETGEERPRLPTDHFPRVVGEGMGPDLSLMAKARAAFHGPYGTGINQLVNGIGGPEYIHAVLTGYTGEELEQAGTVLYQNTAFPSGYIAMPPPLSDDLVTYEDGTPATVDQMSRDVSAFLMWAAEPKMMDRKTVGLVSVLLLIVLTSLLYLTNKRLWAPHKHKLHKA